MHSTEDSQCCAAEDDEDSDDDEDDSDDEDNAEASSSVDAAGGAVEGSLEGEEDATEEEEEEDTTPRSERKYMTPPKGMTPRAFYCHKIFVEGLPKGFGCPSRRDVLSSTHAQEGFWMEPEKLQDDLENLKSSGFFRDVKIKVCPALLTPRPSCSAPGSTPERAAVCRWCP